jgi:DNA primase
LNLSFLQNSLNTGNQSNKPPIAITSSQQPQPAVQSQLHPSSSSPERAHTRKTNRSTPHRHPHDHPTRIPSPIVKEKMKQNYLALVNRSNHQQQLQRKEKEKERQSRRRPSSSSPPPSSRKEKPPVPSSSSPHLSTTHALKKKNEQQQEHTTDPSRSLVQSFLAENNLFGPSSTIAPHNTNSSQLNSLNNSYSSLKEILSVQKESYPIQHILQNSSFSHATIDSQQQQHSSRAAMENSLLNTSRVSTSSGKPPLHPSRAQNESSFRKEGREDEQEDDNEDPNITSLSALLEKYKITVPTEGTATPTRKLYPHAKKTISSGKKSKKKKRSTSAPPIATLYRPVPSPTSTWGTSKRIL